MRIYSIQGPDGRIYDIEGPDDATDADVVRAASQLIRAGAATPATTAPAQPAKAESTFLEQVADVPLQFGSGVVRGVRMVADAFGAGSDASNALRGVEDYIAGLLSAKSKEDSQEIARIMKEAEDNGVGAQVAAAWDAFRTAPIDMIAQGFGTAAPAIAAAVATGATGGAAPLLASTAVGATMGAGSVKSAIYDATLQELRDVGVPDDVAAATAEQAQAYGGKNLDQILIGAGIGAIAGRTGIEGAIAQKIMGRAAATTAAAQTAKGAIRVGVEEALPEIVQGAQEQLATNLALQREGQDVPTGRGVAGAGTLEGLAGLGVGTAFGAMSGGHAKQPKAAPAGPASVAEEEAARRHAEILAAQQQSAESADVRAAAEEAEATVSPEAKTPAEPTPAEPTPAEPTPAEPTPAEPTPSQGTFTEDDVLAAGGTNASYKPWFRNNVVGKTVEEVQAVVDAQPDLVKGNTYRAKTLRALLTPEPPAYAEPEVVQPTGDTGSVVDQPVGVAGRPDVEPDVGAPSGAGGAAIGNTADTLRIGAPAPGGVAPSQPPAGSSDVGTEPINDTVTEPQLGTETTETVEAKTERPKPTTRRLPAPKVAPEDVLAKTAATLEQLAATEQTDAEQALSAAISAQEDAGLALYEARAAREQAQAYATGQIAGSTGNAFTAAQQLAEATANEAKAKKAYEGATAKVEEAQAMLRRVAPQEGLPSQPRYNKAAKAADLELINSAVEQYNAPAASENVADIELRDARAKGAVEYLVGIVDDRSEAKAAREAAAKAIEDHIDPKDVEAVRNRTAEPEPVPQGELSDTAKAALDTNDLAGALRNVAETTTSKEVSALVRRIADFVAGVEVTVVDNLKHPKTGKRVRGLSQGDRITLDRKTGVNEEVLVHEAIHAATVRVLEMDPSKRTEAQAAAVAELDRVMKRILKDRPDLKTDPAFENLQEFVANALSNRNLQTLLRKTRMGPLETAWTKLSKAILRMLGVKKPTNAMDVTLAAVDTILTAPEFGSGQRGSVYAAATNAPMTPQQALNMVKTSGVFATPPGPMRKALSALTSAVSRSAGTSAIDKFRTIVVDNAASLESQFNALFDNKVRTASGLLNPMGLVRQAQDYQQLLVSFLRNGTLQKTADGHYQAVAGGTPSMESVLNDVKAWGEKNGMGFEEASNLASKAFEALRLDGIRAYNNALPAGQKKIQLHRLNPNLNASIDDQIDNMLAFYNATPELLAIKAKLDAVKNGLIDQLVAVGRITAQEGADWKTAVDYVPFDRIDSDTANGKPFRIIRKTGRGLAALGGLPELIGSQTREVGNVLDNSIKLHGWLIGQVLHQDATLTSLRMLDAMGVATDVGAREPSDKSTSVHTYVNGKDRYYTLPDRYMVQAFVQMTWPTGPAVQLAQGAANIFRKTITAMPPFAATQLVKDIQRLFVQSGLQNPYAAVFPTLRHFVQIAGYELLGKEHPILRQMQQVGISGQYDIDARNPAQGALIELGFKPRGWFSSLVHKMEAITRASDVAARIALHERTMAETGDAALAETRAREFINFRRRGSGSMLPTLTATIPFFNAYLQGMDVLYRQATGKGASSGLGRTAAKKAFWSRVGVLAGMSMLYSMAVSGEDDYEELDARVKAGNFIIPGTSVRIPVAGELGMLFKVPVEAALDYFRKSGTPEEREAAELSISVVRYMLEQVSGGGFPQAMKPLLENFTNYSFFTGRPLEGIYQQTKDIQERTTSQTSELAKSISAVGAELFGKDRTVSPIKIDNFLNGYFGTVASTVVMATDQSLNPDRLDRPLNKYWGLAAFMYDREAKSARKNEAYDWNEKAARRLATLRSLISTDPDRAVEYAKTYAPDIALAEHLEGVFKESGRVRKYINDLTNSPLMAEQLTKEEREQRIREAKEYEQELFRPLREQRNEIKRQ